MERKKTRGEKMIVSRAPLRISFAGGITDIPQYYENADYGAVLSTTINKYIYVTVNKKFDEKIRVSYSKTEIVDSVDELEHPIVRECLKYMNITNGIEITSIGDIPSGNGLGSSSTFTVALLHALYRYKDRYPTKEQIANDACYIEMDVLGEPIGKQDQYASAFGGLNYIRFYENKVCVEPINISNDIRDKLNNNLMLFHIGKSCPAKDVLKNQVMEIKDKLFEITELKHIAKDMGNLLTYNSTNMFIKFGELLDAQWKIKRKMNGVSNKEIDDTYNLSKTYGSLGGKICGAGGRGFLLLYCDRKDLIINFMQQKGFKEVKFSFEDKGSEIIYDG